MIESYTVWRASNIKSIKWIQYLKQMLHILDVYQVLLWNVQKDDEEEERRKSTL